MKMSLEDWKVWRDRMWEETKKTPPGRPANAEFAVFSFSWDYHYAYPSGSVRLHYIWHDGELTGWRTPHWTEGPGMRNVAFDDTYLTKITVAGLAMIKKDAKLKQEGCHEVQKDT